MFDKFGEFDSYEEINRADKAQLDDRITKAAGLTPPLYISIPGKAQIKEIVRKYYLGEKK